MLLGYIVVRNQSLRQCNRLKVYRPLLYDYFKLNQSVSFLRFSVDIKTYGKRENM